MFPYIAHGKWPSDPNPQTDWVNCIFAMSYWLNTNIGPQNQAWIWAVDPIAPTASVIAFKEEKHKTFFLLQWA